MEGVGIKKVPFSLFCPVGWSDVGWSKQLDSSVGSVRDSATLTFIQCGFLGKTLYATV